MREDFRALLLSDSDIAGEVGDQVYTLYLSNKATYPAITYQVISDQSEQLLEGAGRIRRARIQVDIWDDDISKCEEIADFVRTLLDGQDNTQGSTRFRATWLDNEQDLWEESIEKYRILSDYEIVYWPTS